MPAISLPVRLPSTSLASKCMIAIQVSCASKYTFPISSTLHGLRTALEMFRTLFNKLDPKTPLSLPISKPISNFHLLEKPSTMIFLPSSFSIRRLASGQFANVTRQLAECTMHPLHLASASTFVFSLPLLKALHHMKTFVHLMVLLLQPLERHASHVVFWKMIKSGSSVFKRLHPCKQAISSANSLHSSFVNAIPLILLHCGINSGTTSVMICAIIFNTAIFAMTPLKMTSRTMAS